MDTYNPILRVERIVKRGLGIARPRPSIGVAHVLFGPRREPVVLQQGNRLPLTDAVLGGYTQAYYIDVAMRRLERTIELPCRGDAHNFEADLWLTCWVAHPTEVVRYNIQDAGAVLWPAIMALARQISRKYFLGDTSEAEAAITQELANVRLHPAFATQPIQVHLSPDPQAIEIARRSTNVTAWNSFVDNPLVAAYLAEHPGDIGGALSVVRELIQQHEEGVEAYRAVGGRVGPEIKAVKKDILERQVRQLGLRPQSEIPTDGIRPVLPPRGTWASIEEEEEAETVVVEKEEE
jgi:hypothetical protein